MPGTGDRPSVLIVEDDSEIADVVEINLKDLNLRTRRASDGRSGLNMALGGDFVLIILDLMLPELDGLAICSRIREEDKLTPILMLTARSDEIDRVVGLEIGADDYLTKPFSVRELVARVKALLRRSEAGRESRESQGEVSTIELGELLIDIDKRKVSSSGETVELTAKEFDLLVLFARNPGRAFSRTDLLNLVWGYQFEGYEHTVNTHINRLRSKIEFDPGQPRYLKTLWGVGYRFAEIEELSQ